MTRRSAILAALGSLLAGFYVPAGAHPATPTKALLRIPLDQWSGITFESQGQTVTLTGAELFRIIKGGK